MKTASKTQMPIAVVLRYSDNMLDDQTSTVQEHNNVLRKNGKVWFGKFGKPFSPALIASLNHPAVSLTVVAVRSRKRPSDDEPRIFGATSSGCENKRPPAKLIPAYYRHLDLDTWFCLISELKPLTQRQIEQWLVLTSEQPLMYAIASTPRTFFFATSKSYLAQARAALGVKAAAITYSAEHGTHRLGRPRRSATPKPQFESEDFSEEESTGNL